MDLFVDTDKVNAEVAPPTIRRRSTEEAARPTPVGKRDIDISATSLRQKWVFRNDELKWRVMNKQGKDYSSQNASAIQKDYISTNSTREAILESRKQALSVTNADDADALKLSWLRLIYRISSHTSSSESLASPSFSFLHSQIADRCAASGRCHF